MEFYKDKPVFIASDSKQLKAAVAKYKGEVVPPYVVKISLRTKKVRKEAFMDDMTVGVVLLHDEVKEIGKFAFAGCKKMTEIVMDDSLEVIGFGAFEDCYALTDVHIPDSVTKIRGAAFSGCKRLKTVRIDNPKLLEKAGLEGKTKIVTKK